MRFWHLHTGDFLDVVFPGWGQREDGTVTFNARAMVATAREFEACSRWTFSGEDQVVLLDYVYEAEVGWGALSFNRCVVLPIRPMIDAGTVRDLDDLVARLTHSAREPGAAASVERLAARTGVRRSRSRAEDWVLGRLLRGARGIADDLRYFQICDLRPHDTRGMV
jgi:hypothetical protein